MKAYSFRLPIRTVSEMNARGHWAIRQRRFKSHKAAVSLFFPKAAAGLVPCRVFLIRNGPRKLDDDNLRSAMKAIRDGIASKLGIDDGDERVTWGYGQCKARAYAVDVVIEGTG